ncbi:unnamed protein product [Cyprideis torosa]|uniref:Phosphatidylinositol-4,5-bisphosphate 4-phosphatase n=1 Tax=Cyprideis torosa TaxID=163714 RepID=A0A7R8WJS1_9CRUS|nr:unnamed protein product [Cyprideis torosa]CAG0896281.1 unnamed protein product [Cyprideis torosa]
MPPVQDPERKPLLTVSGESNDPANGWQPDDEYVDIQAAPIDLPRHSGRQGPPLQVCCRVCQCMIDITGKMDQHVVKCEKCSEATPIKNAPAGKKYVRCPCNCLLICKTTSQRIACPRANCKRVINLGLTAPQSRAASTLPGICRVTCAHCHDFFFFNTLNQSSATCPHCRKSSSVGREFARNRGIICLIFGLLFLIIGLGVTFGTYKVAATKGGIYVAYVGAFLLSLIFLYKAITYFTMKVSYIEGPL